MPAALLLPRALSRMQPIRQLGPSRLGIAPIAMGRRGFEERKRVLTAQHPALRAAGGGARRAMPRLAPRQAAEPAARTNAAR
jgi:hypothetical protein